MTSASSLKKDAANLTRFKMVGGRLLLKKGILPHKFECQGRSQGRARPAAARRDQQRNLAAAMDECANEVSIHQCCLQPCNMK